MVVLWLRHETKVDEHRSALTPSVCKALIEKGFKIFVERSTERFFHDQEFADVGCELVATGSWREAPSDYFIVGLKELPENDHSPLKHRHIFFGHSYKYQKGWKEFLARFSVGGGTLLDMEYLTDEKGRRVAAFGYYAGFAGAAVGLDVWCHQRLGALKMEPSTYPSIEPFKNEEALISFIKAKFESIQAKLGNKEYPKIHVMGALGRCGSGAVDFALKAGVPSENILRWDMAETAKGGPFPEIMDNDIFVNCIYLSQPIPPFINNETLALGGKLSVLVDVSCDITNPHNPIPVYTTATSFKHPTIQIAKGPNGEGKVDVISIDHLPTLLPRESSDRFSNDLYATFLELNDYENARVWNEAVKLFKQKVEESKTSNL
jgi:saccharopine dehydrogenase (NAD+, L-lysine-forming)